MIEMFILEEDEGSKCPHIQYVKYPFYHNKKVIYQKVECIDCGKEIRIEKLF